MLKNTIIGLLTVFTLLMSGCGDNTSNEGELKLEVQQMLDNGDFQGVIDKLKPLASSHNDYILLASAYMGRAGLTLKNLLSTLTNTANTTSNGFSDFTTKLSSMTSATAVADLKESVRYFKKVVKNKCSSEDKNITSSEKSICLYIGLASTSSAASTIKLLTNDITTFGQNGKIDNKLRASTCAMKYAFDRNISSISDCSVTEDNNITFKQSQKTYTLLSVTITDTTGPHPFEYLMTDANTTALTKEYCTLDNFSTRQENEDIGYYVCPVQEAPGDDITSTSVLVDALNNGIDATKNGIGKISGATDIDVGEKLHKYKCEILGGKYEDNNCTVSTTDPISTSNITDYLLKFNQ